MGQTFSAFLALMAFLLLSARPAAACSCASPTLESEIAHSDVIFVGRVVAVKAGRHPDQIARIDFRVSKYWKGNLRLVVSLTTLASLDPGNSKDTIVLDNSCDYGFGMSEEYLVYASYSKEHKLVTISCSLTKAVFRAAEDLKVLGPSKIPK
jgi:hypothetical protein